MLTVALAGNPNVGKSVIFNALTGLQQKVSNFPRTTVERKDGTMDVPDIKYCQVTDLPGIYSLTAESLDELVSRDFILDQRPELLVNIIDGSNLERHLYLTMQLIELQVPMIICLNKMDIATSSGTKINAKKLAEIFGVPVIPMVATKREGIQILREEIHNKLTKISKHHIDLPKSLEYSSDLETAVKKITTIFQEQTFDDHRFSEHSRWMAIKYLEEDKDIVDRINNANLDGQLPSIRSELAIEDPSLYFADLRYQKIEEILNIVEKKPEISKISATELIDEVLTHKWLGIPIFISLMWIVFEITFSIGDPFMGLVELIFYYFGVTVKTLLGSPETNIITAFLQGTIVDGVGSIIIFLPNIILLMLAIAVLEDSGYMSRACFNMDRILRAFGLHGQSFIPMAIGVGCTVPALMAARGMRSETDRLVTMLVTPFISCSARLPVYVVIAGALFTGRESTVILFLYLLGIIIAIIMSLLLRNTLFREKPSPFLMEFPTYLLPSVNSVGLKAWLRGKSFIRKAGGIIFLTVSIIWVFDQIGLIEPIGEIMKILFFPFNLDWQLGAVLLFGFIAKEVVVGALGTLYGDLSGEGLQEYLATDSPFAGEPATALAYLVFVLLYIPCVAVVGTMKQETGGWKWPLFLVSYTTVVAYIVALLTLIAYPLIGPILGV